MIALTCATAAVAALLWPGSDAHTVRLRRLTAQRRLPLGGPAHSTAGIWSAVTAIPVRQTAIWCGGVGGVAAVLVVARGWGPAVAGALAAIIGTVGAVSRDAVRRRAAARRRADLLAAVALLVAELEAGARPGAALAAAAELGGVDAAVLHRAARAADAGGDAAAELATTEHTRALAVAWSLGQDTGSALAGVLGRVAADFSAADEQRRQVGVALSGPRSSAAVLTGLPVLGVVLGVAMGADPVSFLLDSSAGRLVCSAGVLFDVAGVLWLRRILRSAEGG